LDCRSSCVSSRHRARVSKETILNLLTASSFRPLVFVAYTLVYFVVSSPCVSQDDLLPSWNENAAKQSILDFVAAATTEDSKGFLNPAARVAIFDDDGTLWPESPIPFRFAFAIDELRRLNASEPGWDTNDLLQAAIKGERQSFTGPEMAALWVTLAEKQVGLSQQESTQRIKTWALQANHPRFKQPYTDLAFQPMLEVLSLLKTNGFKCYILADQDADFTRIWSEEIFGIPREQVFGPFSPLTVEWRDELPVLVKQPARAGDISDNIKLVEIHRHIGRLPVICFANADSDLPVLLATTNQRTSSLGVIIHHTDQDREYFYDAQPSSTGKLTEALTKANLNHWLVVDMKTDWKNMFVERKSTADDFVGIPSGVDFAVESIGGVPVIESSGAMIRFEPQSQVSGSTGCNRFSCSFSIEAKTLVLGPIAMTRRACAPVIMEQESRMSQSLQRVANYKFDENTNSLQFFDKDSQLLMKFSRVIDSRE